MTAVTEDGQDGAQASDHGREQLILARGEHTLRKSKDRPGCANGAWRIVVLVREHLITRSVCYKGKPWSPVEQSAPPAARQPDEVIWPTWPATVEDEITTSASPLKDLQQRWDATISRLRDSAKWLATVIGAALASTIPTAPLAGLSRRHISAASVVLGIAGLLLVSCTLLLVLQVMRPQSVSYVDIQEAKPPEGLRARLRSLVRKHMPYSHAMESPLYRWQHTILAHPDLYLPCGVYSLVALRQLMIVEEITLVALSCASEDASDEAARENIAGAQAARAARLYELRAAASNIVTVGMYYIVRARSTRATYLGVASGLTGIVAIITAVTLR
jgi:hypothetical protein